MDDFRSSFLPTFASSSSNIEIKKKLGIELGIVCQSSASDETKRKRNKG